MDSLWSWLSSHGPWSWLSPPSLILTAAGWLSRRRWRRWLHPAKALASCLGDVKDLHEDLKDCRQSRDAGRSAIDYATYALEEIVQSAERVKTAAATGRLTNSNDSSPAPSPSPATSPPSRRRRKPGPRARR